MLGGHPGDERLGPVTAGDPQQVGPAGHGLAGERGHVDVRALEQDHLGAERLGLLLQVEPAHLAPAGPRVHHDERVPRAVARRTPACRRRRRPSWSAALPAATAEPHGEQDAPSSAHRSPSRTKSQTRASGVATRRARASSRTGPRWARKPYVDATTGPPRAVPPRAATGRAGGRSRGAAPPRRTRAGATPAPASAAAPRPGPSSTCSRASSCRGYFTGATSFDSNLCLRLEDRVRSRLASDIRAPFRRRRECASSSIVAARSSGRLIPRW